MNANRKPSSIESSADAVRRYHEETKHRPGRYARSAGYMDWANQPDPFRRFEGSPRFDLPFLNEDPHRTYINMYGTEISPRSPLDTRLVGGILELSLGISAWKSFGGESWALRMNPSSGNLHPTECHLMLPPMNGRGSQIAHYDVYRHALEVRADIPPSLWESMEHRFGPGFGLLLSGIFWREAWKYGERALRYTAHDAGHALAAVRIAAGLFGYRAVSLAGAADSAIEILFGLNKMRCDETAREHPELFVWLSASPKNEMPHDFEDTTINEYDGLPFIGEPTPLSREIVRWDRIYDTTNHLQKPFTGAPGPWTGTPVAANEIARPIEASHIIRQRRSAQRFSPDCTMDERTFFAILERTLPRRKEAPFDVNLGPPEVDLLLFVHRVQHLAPGLYWLSRTERPIHEIASRMRSDFEWTRVHEDLPLYRLKKSDVKDAAKLACCNQDIAADSAFCVGMISRFEEIIVLAPWRYKFLHFEAGMIGQVLYWEAEAHGFRGTGIGCFFDDLVHGMLGLEGMKYQSLYHFTIGAPIVDARLSTLPPYRHLSRS